MNLKIFPCNVRPVIPNPPEFVSDLCLPPISIFGSALAGVEVVYSPIAYILYFVLIILIPYILACTISTLFKKR
ncbi:MAG: hypothetical protein IB618_03165 [Candidatus Pacearchaeota archaeon]|nr:MAG: hypothetical protein IB618_03165 [Candidatus Pacearchaeota archaeon]